MHALPNQTAPNTYSQQHNKLYYYIPDNMDYFGQR